MTTVPDGFLEDVEARLVELKESLARIDEGLTEMLVKEETRKFDTEIDELLGGEA